MVLDSRPSSKIYAGVIVAELTDPPRGFAKRFTGWLLEDRVGRRKGSHEQDDVRQHHWWQVACLTGVDYFSTLGYQPSIAVVAAGALSPISTLLIVLLTLFGALPMYRRVAAHSPEGQGSISMLEGLLSFWKGKIFVLCLLGFIATDFIITITLSSSDAASHITENSYVAQSLGGHEIIITLVLVALLGVLFLRGFREAIGIAVIVVGTYLLLNLVVVFVGLYESVTNPQYVTDWTDLLFSSHGGDPLAMIAVAVLVFPKLALGLSGFETGVAVMPLVRGDDEDTQEHPTGRVRNTGKLLTTAALTMSFYLVTTSFVSTVLIPPEQFEPGGAAKDRALAYLAHGYLGDVFGTVYDLSTILILAFAGASALAGLLNVVPRYLPRYGMVPAWGTAVRPLVLVFTAIAFAIVIIFGADVDAQGGAYATGVLVIMTSAAFAVALAAWRGRSKWGVAAFGLVTVVFAYTLVANVLERPDGVKIASFFILAIIVLSFISRVWRTTELRAEGIELDEVAQGFVDEASKGEKIHVISHRHRGASDDPEEYTTTENEHREDNHVPTDLPILFLEVEVDDPSEFEEVLKVQGVDVGGYKVLRTKSPTVPNAIAAILLHLRDTSGKEPHCYFGWTEGNPIAYLFRYILLGEGDTAPVTHEVLREAEPDRKRRPAIHVGGK
jgi:hypothetical protein